MKTVNTCAICGRLVLEKKICTTCEKNLTHNDDPFEVAEKNIWNMVFEYGFLEDKKQKFNVLREIDFVANQAYMRGYISEEAYIQICSVIGTEPLFDQEKHLNNSEYDMSDLAKQGFVMEIMVSYTEE